MIRIDLEMLIFLHDNEIRDEEDPHIKNKSLLLSAINNPYQTAFGVDLYPTNELKISMMVFSIIRNHGFNDGNKRTGIKVLQTLLDDCDIELNATEEDYIQLALDIVNHYEKEDIVNWINRHRI